MRASAPSTRPCAGFASIPQEEAARDPDRVEVDDQAKIHNFHLTGPGVEETTDVARTGPATWEVIFEAGEYTFVCDPHAGSMRGTFTVA